MRSLLAATALFALVACNSNNSAENKEAPNTDSVSTTVAANNSLSESEKSEGWQLLFDGNDKTGWHIYNGKSDGSAWQVTDGCLHLSPGPKNDWQTVGGGDLISDSSFDNFDLKLEWKIDTAGNSGVLFYVHEDPSLEHAYFSGPEMQVLDNERHPDAKIVKHRAGDLYDLITSTPETVKPALEWNQVEIIANKGHLEFYLNGTKVVETTMWDDNWKKMIAGSKFKQWPPFGTFQTGHIALQDHGAQVWYRNIKIRKL
jgi:hypothetical protein